jgi:hypothetical protein
MVILIFDTYGGLCNQMYDIVNGINFCLKNNIFFTFRYCSFRNNNLISWREEPFEKLFDLNLLKKYKLYINYYSVKDDLTNDNCFNLNAKYVANNVFSKDNILNQLINLNKKYVVLKQFWALYAFRDFIDNTIHRNILPSNHIMEKYIEIKNKILKDSSYNFIHYRYEIDFTSHFKCQVESLDNLINKLVFKNNELNIYIATTNIKNLLDLENVKYKNILYKNEDDELNFEEQTFIDFMIGLNSEEHYGHKKSSFSVMINNIKSTNNYYDI